MKHRTADDGTAWCPAFRTGAACVFAMFRPALSVERLAVLARVTSATRRVRAVFVACILALAAPGAANSQSVPSYVLSSNDVLQITVVDRLAVPDAASPIEKASGTYSISPSGLINLAFVGAIEARGLSSSDLSTAIAAALAREFGLVEAPGVAVSVAEYAPVFVVGDVAAPGAYALPPGALALQALALAGGLGRAEAQSYTIERNLVEGRFDAAQLTEEVLRLDARAARLAAEQAGDEDIAFPQALLDMETPMAIQAMSAEREAFALGRQMLDEDLAELDELEGLLRAEIASSERKLATQRERLDVVATVSTDLDQLAERGLVRTDRLLAIQSTQASIEVTVIDLEQAIFQGRARLAEIARERRFLTTARADNALRELIEVRAERALAASRVDEAERLSRLSSDYLGVAQAAEAENPEPRYTILRDGEGGLQEIEAFARSRLLPNDVLEILVTD